MKQAVPSPPRFRSRVFSTPQRFLAQSNFAALFRAAAARRHLLQSLPLAGIVVASRRHQLPGRSPPACLNEPSSALSPPVSPTTTLARSSLDPPAGYGFPFRAARRRASWSPWTSDSRTVPFRQLRRLRSLTPPASPFQPYGYLTATPGRYSPGLLPLQSTTSRTSGSRTRPSLTARTRHLHPQMVTPRPNGPLSPSSRVEPHHAPKHATQLTRQLPIPFETGPRRPSAAPLLP